MPRCILPEHTAPQSRMVFYTVFEDVSISQKTRAMGRRLGNTLGWAYQIKVEGRVWKAVEHEILKIWLPVVGGKSLWEAALCGMELYSDYFGAYLTPSQMPLCYTLRGRPLETGSTGWRRIGARRCWQCAILCGMENYWKLSLGQKPAPKME